MCAELDNDLMVLVLHFLKMPPKNSLKVEQERTRKLKEEVEQMEKMALQFTTIGSSGNSVQSVTFAGLGTAVAPAPAAQKSGQTKARTTNVRAAPPGSASRPPQARVPAPPHASHGPMASAKLTSSNASTGLVKPNAIKSPLPAISSRPSSGTTSTSRHQVASSSKYLSSKPQVSTASIGTGCVRSRKGSAVSSQASSRKSSISGPEDAGHRVPEAVTKQSVVNNLERKQSGRVLKRTSQSTNPQSVTEFLMREGDNFTLGKDIFIKGDAPISTACDMAIGDDSQLGSDICGPSPASTAEEKHDDSTAAAYEAKEQKIADTLGIPLEENSPKQQHVRFAVNDVATTEPTRNSSQGEACGTSNEAEAPVPYFAQMEKAIVLKTLTEMTRTQETPEERHARLLELALQETPAPIEGLDDDLNAELVISPEDIMAELATLVN